MSNTDNIDLLFEAIRLDTPTRIVRSWKVEVMMLVLETSVQLANDAKEDCPICISNYSMMKSITTNCGHMFCHDCACSHLDNSASRRKPACPMCRADIKTLEVKDVEYLLELEEKYM